MASKFRNPQKISMKVDASKTNRGKHDTEIIHALCNCDESRGIIPCLVHSLQHWINMQNARHEIKFKSNDFTFIHKSGKLFRCDHLNNWLQNAMATVAGNQKMKLDPSIYTAHTLRKGGCTDVASHGVSSCRIEMTGTWSSKKRK